MVSALAVAGLVVIVAVHTVVAAVLTRLLRVRLATRWGALVYAAVVVPVVLLASTLVLSGVLGLGPNLGGRAPALLVMIGAPFALGVTIDYVWMPRPEDVELPEPAE